MLNKLILKTSLTLVCIPLLLAGCASSSSKEDVHAGVRAAETTLASFKSDPDMVWLQQNMKNAKAVLVSPNIMKAGFIVGGSGGNAVALSRAGAASGASGTTGASGASAASGAPEWSSPAFYKLATASIGFQAGVQSSELVALIMTDKALNSLLSNSFKVGGDVSVAAGPVGAGSTAPLQSDMVIFTRSKGLYGGLNLDGTSISIDEEANRAFYGRPASAVDILVTRSATSPEGVTLARIASSPGPTATGGSAPPAGTTGTGTK